MDLLGVAGTALDWPQLRAELAGQWERQVERARGWWEALPGERRRLLLAGSGVGAVLGLVLGLAMPMLMASVQSALIGSVLICVAGRSLLLQQLPSAESMMPGSWRGALLTVGLITLLGVLVQWTLRRRKSDD